MHTQKTQKYPNFPEVASDPKEPAKITEFLTDNPDSNVTIFQPVENETGETELISFRISN